MELLRILYDCIFRPHKATRDALRDILGTWQSCCIIVNSCQCEQDEGCPRCCDYV